MSVEIKWRDGMGNQVEDSLGIFPGSDEGVETLSSSVNKGIDRQLTLKAEAPTGQFDTLTVIQEGCREPYLTSDGQRYVTSDGQVFGLLKEGAGEECLDCAVSHVVLDMTKTDPSQMISGDVNGEAIQYIRQNSHRYLARRDSSDGVMAICQLDDADSTLYADGSEASLDGAEGDVFMRLPRFFYHAEMTSQDVWDIGFSAGMEADGWKEWDGKDLVGVYKGYVSDGKLRSWSGQTPTTDVSQTDFKAYAQANGDGYSLVRFKHHSMMAFLFYALYGNTDSQAICGTGSDVEGRVTGATNGMGMTDTVADVNGNTGSINFWGLENWWGDLYEWVDNVVINNRFWQVTRDDGTAGGFFAPSEDGFISKVHVGDKLDMIPSAVGASGTTGFCDYYAQYAANSLVLARSCYGSHSYGGVTCASANSGASDTSTDCGSRLAFRGEMKEMLSSSDFKAIS